MSRNYPSGDWGDALRNVRTPAQKHHNDTVYAVLQEAARAQESYGDFASMHEAYGVLCEEVAELFDAVRMRQSDGRMRIDAIYKEAIQVAAVALRMAEQAGRVTR